jgi:metallophosphoesterase superfamily enzyme
MKILIVADLHIRKNHLAAGIRLVNAIRTVIEETTPEFVIFLGDLLDTHATVNVSCFNIISDLLIATSKISTTYVLLGNHDMSNPGRPLTTESSFDIFSKICIEDISDKKSGDRSISYRKIKIIREPVLVKLGELPILLSPYLETGKFLETLKTKVGDFSDAKMIFCHQEFEDSVFKGRGDKWDTSLPMVFSGHIHPERRFDNGVFYVGAPCETGNIWQIRVTDSVKLKKIKLDDVEIKTDKPMKKLKIKEIEKSRKISKTILEILKERIKDLPNLQRLIEEI